MYNKYKDDSSNTFKVYEPVNSTAECKICQLLIKERTYINLSRLNNDCVYGPCYPKILDYPHHCCWNLFNIAYHAYKNRSISEAHFNEWMQLNCGIYFDNNSDYAFSLHDERKQQLKENYPDLELKSAVIKVIDEMEGPLPAYLRIKTCDTHGIKHLKIFNHRRLKNISIHELRVFQDLYPASTKVDARKTNIALKYVIQDLMHSGDIPLINRVLATFPIGTPESIIVMHLLNALGNDQYDRFVSMMEEDKACCMTPQQYFKYAKAVGIAVRRCGKWYDGTMLEEEAVCLLSYWEMCTGRSGHTSDWPQEYVNRIQSYIPLKPPHLICEPTTETNGLLLDELAEELMRIFDCMITTTGTESWLEFLQRRQTWVAGGTASGEYIEIDGKRQPIDKKVFCEKTPTAEMESWLYEEPEIVAIASEKYEIGKPRAIYGTTPKSYCIITYALQHVENNMSKVPGLESGLSEIHDLIAINRRAIECGIAGMYTTMVDFEDFNLQHTLSAQYLMFECMAKTLEKKGAHPDQVKAAMWAAKGCLNQKVRFPGSKHFDQVKQGMFSGVRSTDFMNSVLNLAYFNVAEAQISKLQGPKPERLLDIHKGDDVWISNKNLLWAILLYNTMTCTGYKFQVSKQLLAKQEGEFLRVRYFSGRVRGYLCRAIGALIERPLQGQDDTLASNALPSMASQIMILYRRGYRLDACDRLWRIVCNQWCRYKNRDYNDVKIPPFVIHQSDRLNGLDLGPPMTAAKGGTLIASIPRLNSISASAGKHVTQCMTDEYASFVSKYIKHNFDVEAVKANIHKINTVGLVSKRDKDKAFRRYGNELVKWHKKLPKAVQCERSREEYIKLTSGTNMCLPTYRLIKSMMNVTDFRTIPDEQNHTTAIFKAIHSSPLKNIETAQQAMKKGVIESAKLCMAMNPLRDVALRGLAAIEELRRSFNDQVVVRIIKGLRGCGLMYESELHPNIASWMHMRAMQVTIIHSAAFARTDLDGWNQLYDENLSRVHAAIKKEGSLLKISMY